MAKVCHRARTPGAWFNTIAPRRRGATLSPLSLRRYIMNAYGAMYAAQIVGGPEWLNKDA